MPKIVELFAGTQFLGRYELTIALNIFLNERFPVMTFLLGYDFSIKYLVLC